MKYTKSGDTYIIKLFKGEKIMEYLVKFCEVKKITSGIFHAIGAVLDAEISFYNLKTKEYQWKKFNKPMEITGMTGNVALFEGKPLLHIHLTFSDDKMNVVGGHLKEATVGGTCEIFLTDTKIKMEREYDEETGLKLWKF
ncbi:MAG: DNA-binding protein [Candidatus Aenigmarchaeota archaeon]|nr:DNA-binding protein [Candidatus Aenigmarchaeota archaeon]